MSLHAIASRIASLKGTIKVNDDTVIEHDGLKPISITTKNCEKAEVDYRRFTGEKLNGVWNKQPNGWTMKIDNPPDGLIEWLTEYGDS